MRGQTASEAESENTMMETLRGSVFRENVGWALLNFYGKKPLESYGTKKNYRKQNSGGALEKE